MLTLVSAISEIDSWIWRHVVRRSPVTYHPTYWSMVFPLGMYTVATHRLSLAAELLFLQAIPRVTIWAALGVWVLTMAGLLQSLARAGVQILRPGNDALGATATEASSVGEHHRSGTR